MPDGLLKAKGKKEQSEPQWELIASTPEELTDLGEKLRRSKKKPDQILANMVSLPTNVSQLSPSLSSYFCLNFLKRYKLIRVITDSGRLCTGALGAARS